MGMTAPDFRDGEGDGWAIASNGKRHMWSVYSGQVQDISGGLSHVSFAMQNVFNTHGYCILYKNVTNAPKKVSKVKIHATSCNTGTSDFWTNARHHTTPANGAAVNYTCTLKVFKNYTVFDKYNTNSKKIKVNGSRVNNSHYTDDCAKKYVIRLDGVSNGTNNLVSKGTSTSNPAVFRLLRDPNVFDLSDKNIEIPKNGILMIQFDVSGGSADTCIRFSLDSRGASIETDEEVDNGYLYVYDIPEDADEDEPEWILTRGAYIYTHRGWERIEKVLRKNNGKINSNALTGRQS